MAADVLQVITSVQLGGAENVAISLAKHCSVGAGRRLIIVELFRSKDKYAEERRREIEGAHIEVVTLSALDKRLGMLVAPFALARLMIRERPSLIHSHTDLPDFVLSCALRLVKAARQPLPKILRTIHNVSLWSTRPRLGAWVEGGIDDHAVVAVSGAAMQAYCDLRTERNLPLAKNRQIVYNGLGWLAPRAYPFHLCADRINIVFCGRFTRQKGVDLLTPLVSRIQRVHPNTFCFHFIGAGPLRSLVDALVESTPGVSLHEPIVDLASVLHVFDYMIMPSRFEGFGLVAVEAALAGVPVIAAHVPGLKETQPPLWPLFFDPEAPASALPILESIASGGVDRPALVSQTRAFAEQNFSQGKMIDAYNSIFEDCISSLERV